MKRSRKLVRVIVSALSLVVLLHGHSILHAQQAAQGSKSGWIPPSGHGMKERGWRLGTFQSKTAGAMVGYCYYLPPSYETSPDKRYPVIYWLHGLGGSPASANPVVSLLDAGINAGTAPEVLLVSCTDPTKRSMWTDSKDGTVPVETVIVNELIPHIDATFRTIASRRGRATEGYSMGGYGAAYLGFKYPDTFGAVSILAGALHSPDTLNARRGEIFQAAFGGDVQYAQARSPWTLLRKNADTIRGQTSVRIHVGEKDQLREWNAQFHDLLGELRIDHAWSLVPDSTHNSAEFFANWPGNLFDFYKRAFAAAVARPRGEGILPLSSRVEGIPPSQRRHELAPAQAGDARDAQGRGVPRWDSRPRLSMGEEAPRGRGSHPVGEPRDALATPAGPPAEGKVEGFIYNKTPQGDLKIHVHFPHDWTAQDQRSAIVFFFGGGWAAGKIEQFEPQAKYLAQRGMVAARADYRVRSRHGTTPDKCVEDAQSAVRWLRANATKLGIDPQRIVASGGSAGGHIAACTATIPDASVAPPRGEGSLPLFSRVEGVPPSERGQDACDTQGQDALATAAGRRPQRDESRWGVSLQAEGEDLSISSRPNLLVLFNPVLDTITLGEKYGMSEIGCRISPNHHLSKDLPPTIIFFGTEDRFLDGGKEFIAQAKHLGLQARMHLAPGQPHGFFNRSPWQERTTFLMDEFLAIHGYLEGKPTLALPPGGVTLTRYEPAQ